MKRIVKLLFVTFISLLILTGCNNKEELTPANALTKDFKNIIKEEKDVLKIADKISKNDAIKTKTVVEERKKGDYLTGFDENITNYTKSAVIQPMIGSIPFIAYVFKTENTKELEEELKNKSNPRWNICVEADETVIEVQGDYVFFVMSPKNFEE